MPTPSTSVERRTALAFQVLRVTVALCFIGHGAWGVVTKEEWVPFFAVVGIGRDTAYTLMPWVGAMDIGMGLLVLARPTKLVLAWMVLWGGWTALLRPLAGMGWWELFERGGNYGPPLALLVLGLQAHPRGGWLRGFGPQPPRRDVLRRVAWVLRLSIVLLLLGHGGFCAFQEKQMLLDQWAAVGIGDGGPGSVWILNTQGWIEIALALLVLIRPTDGLLVLVLVFKLAIELLYPATGPTVDVFEFVERWGDYGAPLALILVQRSLAEL